MTSRRFIANAVPISLAMALFPVEDGFDGLERLDGGRTRARTCDPMINSLALTVLFQLLSCKLGRPEV